MTFILHGKRRRKEDPLILALQRVQFYRDLWNTASVTSLSFLWRDGSFMLIPRGSFNFGQGLPRRSDGSPVYAVEPDSKITL